MAISAVLASDAKRFLARPVFSGTDSTSVFQAAQLGNLSAATIVAPLYWDVSYSLDGSTFTRFDTVPIRTLVYWAGPQWYVPGLYEVDFDLPSACFGQKDVTIRLQAASKVCGRWSTSIIAWPNILRLPLTPPRLVPAMFTP